MRTIETKAYKYEELSDAAKEKARDWWRSGGLDYEWWDTAVEDAANIAELFGLDVRQESKQRGDKSFYYKETIYFSGFSSQGSGACFKGEYRYKKGALKAVKDYAPKDEELHGIVQRLQNAQKRAFYGITATTVHSGHYSHSGCMAVDVNMDDRIGQRVFTDLEEEVITELRRFADWIYARLEQEWEYLNSDESVEEDIINGEYEFTEEGKRV